MKKNLEEEFNIAVRFHRAGDLTNAERSYRKILEGFPNNPKVIACLGTVILQTGFAEKAIIFFNRSLSIDPNQTIALTNLAIALADLKRFEESISILDKVIKLTPLSSSVLNNRGKTLRGLSRFEDALSDFNLAIKLNPNYPEFYNNRGNVLKVINRLEDALSDFNLAIKLNPNYPEFYNNRAVVLKEMKRYKEALVSLDFAISLNPYYQEAYINRGLLLNEMKRYEESLASFDFAISLNTDFAEVYIDRGILLTEMRRYEEALASYDRAVILKPDLAEAYFNRGILLNEMQRYEEALANYNRASGLQVDLDYGLGSILAVKMQLCDWGGVEQLVNQLIDGIKEAKKICMPFTALSLVDDLNIHKQASKILVDDKYSAKNDFLKKTRSLKHKKIRLGYFSSDFKEHPVAFLTAQLFETHDRSKFEIIAFSIGHNTGDTYRKRFEEVFDEFIDVREKTDEEIAMLSQAKEIDIAIDLGGYTQGNRTNIFAMRAAPIQVNYLGFAGTMAAEYIDYIIADSTIIPHELQCHYSEKVVYIPGTYMVNDSTLKPSDTVFSRKDFNLPEEGFIFSCFNAQYKITPSTFLGWMRILNAVDRSVLWLSHMNETAMKSLREKAEEFEIESHRIIFATRMPSLSDHLSRIRLADLFLDTFPYNAHTTSNDALRVGLPVLTLIGKSFASRVAASLLNAVDMPELITNSQEDYESLAIELASNPEKLKNIRTKLLNNLHDSYLADTNLFTKNLESAYLQMYQRYQQGLSPDNIYIN